MNNLKKLVATFRRYSAEEKRRAESEEIPETSKWLLGKSSGFELAAKWLEEELSDMTDCNYISEDAEIERRRQAILRRTSLGRQLLLPEAHRTLGRRDRVGCK